MKHLPLFNQLKHFDQSTVANALIKLIFLLGAAYSFADSLTPQAEYTEHRHTPQWTKEQQARGYVTFNRDPLKIVWPNSIPEKREIIQTISITLTPDQSSSIPLYLHTLRSIDNLRIEASLPSHKKNQLNDAIMSFGHMRYAPKGGHPRWDIPHSKIMDVPLFIDYSWPIDIPKGTTQPIWLDIKIPQTANAGHYRSNIKITASNSPDFNIELTIEILPFKLVEASDYMLGLYTWGRDTTFTIRDYKNAYQKMAEYGLTSIALMANVGESIVRSGKTLKINWLGKGQLYKALEAFKEIDFPHKRILWLMSGGDGGDLYKWCQSNKRPTHISVAECYRILVADVLTYAKKRQWPQLILQPIDEPFRKPKRRKIAINTYHWLHGAPDVSLEVNSPNGPHALKADVDFFSSRSDVLTLSRGPYLSSYTFNQSAWKKFLANTKNKGQEIWFYNADITAWHPEIMRFWYGFGLWQSQAKGALQWSYQIDHLIPYKRDPEAIYKNPKKYVFMYPKTQNFQGGPTLGLISIREGINDLRYLLTLKKLVGNCDSAYAKQAWRDIEDHLVAIDFSGVASKWPTTGEWERATKINGQWEISGEFKVNNGLDFSDYSRIRQKVVNHILKLQSPAVCNKT